MKKYNRIASALLAGVMTTGVLAGCSGKDGNDANANKENGNTNVKTSGFPIVETPIKLTFFAGKAASAPANWNELPVWKEYAKLTNIEVDFQLTPAESLAEKRNLVLSSGDYPDAFHTARLSAADVMNYGGQGIFIPLNDLIDKYAPNFKKLLDSQPEVKRGLTMPDGKIYSFPTFYDPDFKSVLIGTKLWYNKAFLDALGMKEPTTTEEYYQYLKAVKTTDLNKNGKADEIPYAGSGYGSLLEELKGAWGLGNRGSIHPRVDMDPSTNKLRFIPTDPRYKEVLEYLNKLYKEGLMVDNLMTIKGPEVNALLAEGRVGSSETNSPHAISGVTIKDFVGAPTLKGPHGDQIFSRARSPLIDVGAFVITNKNKNPEATVRWIDHFYGEEGSKLFFMGVKDVSYVEKPDGTIDYTEEAKKEQSKFLSWAGGFYPAMLTAKTFKGGESTPESMAAAKKVEPNWPKEVWAPFTYTQEELVQFTPISTDLNKYVDEMTAKFVVGDIPFSEWDKYVSTIQKMGLNDYMKIYNAAYERYKK
ncbi:ABC transporter substrate-binding protein [Paenibacillus sp. J31TS4]|uniref:extracellular solute-binding protein n=1 Tax=Paenibacillus sp. J31TS4 TaxID=2807195 RepID=UPI001B0FDEC2|nr:extracellular solute-binding protein [Paenibacillus sp. J31TS4]GIP41208.1 ABC transporter substrate-binding protein [Paenibacillus sp. J31TS4]